MHDDKQSISIKLDIILLIKINLPYKKLVNLIT
jgi:hypothetical protein